MDHTEEIFNLTDINYDILEPINRKDWRESMTKKVYAVVSIDFAKEIYNLKKKKLNTQGKSYIEAGIYGEGAYFIISNLDYAKYLAKSEGKCVLETEVEVNKCLNLLTSTVGQQQLLTIMQSKLIKIENNKSVFDVLMEESEMKYDSVLGLMVDASTFISDSVYQYMTQIICIKDPNCIKRYIKIIK